MIGREKCSVFIFKVLLILHWLLNMKWCHFLFVSLRGCLHTAHLQALINELIWCCCACDLCQSSSFSGHTPSQLPPRLRVFKPFMFLMSPLSTSLGARHFEISIRFMLGVGKTRLPPKQPFPKNPSLSSSFPPLQSFISASVANTVLVSQQPDKAKVFWVCVHVLFVQKTKTSIYCNADVCNFPFLLLAANFPKSRLAFM